MRVSEIAVLGLNKTVYSQRLLGEPLQRRGLHN